MALSKLVDDGNADTLNVKWNGESGSTIVKDWMFSGGNCTDENMLKAFVRTQIYRPLFFKYNDYSFFSGKYSAYKCETTKWFVDHTGKEHQIVLENGAVSKEQSQIVDDPDGKYTIPEGEISYLENDNQFEYYIHYKPVKIVEEKFVVDDVEFYVVRESNGNVGPIKSIYFNQFHGRDDASRETELMGSEVGDRVAHYGSLEIHFNTEWNQATAIKKWQCDVVHRLLGEWCEFDEAEIDFSDSNKTYDWYLANEILRIQRKYQTQAQALLNLGGGNIYDGELECVCTVKIRNDIQNEEIVTVCELEKPSSMTQPMGVVIDREWNVDTNRWFRGTLSDGIVSPSASGDKMFFVKDIGKGLNNVNTAWTSNLNSFYEIHENVAEATWDNDTGVVSVALGDVDVTLTPIFEVGASGKATTTIDKYLVDDGSKSYTVRYSSSYGGYIHFVLNGVRYRVCPLDNDQKMLVDRLDVNSVEVTTVDFSTTYNPDKLRDNFAQNVKNAMLN